MTRTNWIAKPSRAWWNPASAAPYFPSMHCGAGTDFFRLTGWLATALPESLALAMARTDYPRKLTESVADFLQKILASQQ